MGKYSKILVAVDSSASATHALRESFKLAVNEKSWITVTSVAPPYEGDIELTGVRDIRVALRKPCEEILAEAEHIAEDERALIKTVCEEGEPYERIVDLAETKNCDLIIMGRRGQSHIERVLVGNVTSRVIGHTDKDVLVIPLEATVGWKKILIAIDGSSQSEAATARTIEFGRSYGGELVILSVVDVPAEFHAEAPQVVEQLIAKARGYVDAAKKQAEAAGLKAETVVREAETYEAIVELAQAQKADIIVVGSHGRTGLKRLLMGSVTEMVIGYAPCPVLVVQV